MSRSVRLGLAQINTTVGAIDQNVAAIKGEIDKAKRLGVELLVFPELALCGYPPEDLLIRSTFLDACERALHQLAPHAAGLTCLIGAPHTAGGLYNGAAIVSGGAVIDYVLKRELPNYGVFDERRYFHPGDNGPLLRVGDALVGVTICEDIWAANDLIDRQVENGANLLVNLSGSPFRIGALAERREIVKAIARRTGLPMAYCNLVGGQDELVFDGASFVVDGKGTMTATALAFAEELLVIDLPLAEPGQSPDRIVIDTPLAKGADRPTIVPATVRADTAWEEEIYTALTLGVKDYVTKNNFPGVVIGLSGGIDSALTTVIAVDALGPEKVHVVMMPSPYSSAGSVDDSVEMVTTLGVGSYQFPIGEIMGAYETTLANAFAGTEPGVAEENIQARIRGALVMALSNKFGWLAITTGNKSETAVGYATLYGDMAGGFAAIKDLYKQSVYALSRWRNRHEGREIIPQAIIDKEPSAELRPDQKDSDSLPPYDQLDTILEAYIERNMSVEEIVNLGYSVDLVTRIIRLVDRNEHKRRQAPIGVKISARAFGRDRRRPITCGFFDR